MKRQLLSTLVGSALMAWGGSNVGRAIDDGLGTQIHMVLFAMGIVLMATFPMHGLADRLKRLEALLAANRADAPSSGGQDSATGGAR